MSVLVGKAAPDFTAAAVMPDGQISEAFTLSDYLKGAYGLVFFYPLDFTFVCPSEILAYSHRAAKFAELNTKVVAVSVDSQFTHAAWRETPVEKGGLGPVSFPMVADLTKQIARDYDVLINDAVALRGTFLIDRDGVVRHQLVNDLPLGRNADEAVRMVEALQFHEEHGEVCPAGWNKGDAGMTPTAEGVADYLAAHAETL
jgi:peroxiredoxin (alkyl hydroperoxide reductase subunit C)